MDFESIHFNCFFSFCNVLVKVKCNVYVYSSYYYYYYIKGQKLSKMVTNF